VSEHVLPVAITVGAFVLGVVLQRLESPRFAERV
jgi:hypothetical protein